MALFPAVPQQSECFAADGSFLPSSSSRHKPAHARVESNSDQRSCKQQSESLIMTRSRSNQELQGSFSDAFRADGFKGYCAFGGKPWIGVCGYATIECVVYSRTASMLCNVCEMQIAACGTTS